MKWIARILLFLLKVFQKFKSKKKNKTYMFEKNKYKQLLGMMESNNNYKAYNPLSGALGKYQFMPSTLNSIKNNYFLSDWIDKNSFLDNPLLQERYEDVLIEDTLNFINNNNLIQYLGTTVTGSKRFPNILSKVNIYGMLAAAHLSGVGNLQNHFLLGSDPNDGQTSLTDYLAFFSSKLSTSNLIDTTLLAFMLGIVLYWK